jgi:hypothetical protein
MRTRIAITVPARWGVTDQVLVVGARQAMADRDSGRDGRPRVTA